MLCNKTLAGGVKLAMNSSISGLHLRTDIVIVEEQAIARAAGVGAGRLSRWKSLLLSSDLLNEQAKPQTAADADLDELLRESPWPCTKRGPKNYSVELDAQAAPPAGIRINGSNLELSVELLRCVAPANASRHALALFLLTATSALRMVRAYAAQAEYQECFGLQVSLPSSAASAEIDHALAALSIAYRMCAREAAVLLQAAAADHYLAARDHSTTDNHQTEKEN